MNTAKLVIVAAMLAALAPSNRAEAGCGCDHPPPIKGYVYPSFAWPKDTVNVYSPVLERGDKSCVRSSAFSFDNVVVDDDSSVHTELPWFAGVGPTSLDVWAKPCSKVKRGDPPDDHIADDHLTILPHTLPVIEASGIFYYENVTVAVDTRGRILLPFDMTNIRAPMHFFVIVNGVPLRFDHDELDYYNKDEVNLKLFESLVAGPEDHEWGAFYGALVDDAPNPARHSDVISYWRHEFQTYADAHAPGGSHEVDEAGLHPDGSVHIDHYSLVAAMRPRLCDDAEAGVCTRLQGGSQQVTLEVYQLISDVPISMSDLTGDVLAELEDHMFAITIDRKGEATIQPIDSSYAIQPAISDSPPKSASTALDGAEYYMSGLADRSR